MIQKKSAHPKQQLAQHLAHTLGQTLSEQELSNCLQQVEILEPIAGKAFWQTAEATPGIYSDFQFSEVHCVGWALPTRSRFWWAVPTLRVFQKSAEESYIKSV